MVAQLEFTGERVVPGKTPLYLIWAHTARYLWIRKVIRGQTVLDAGCGEGYGAHYLSHHAIQVIGVDISRETIKHARTSYIKPNLAYEVMDCRNLGFAPNSFDVVCSFEVIEHLNPINQFLQGVRRVLKPGGSFYVSTPNGGLNICAGQNPFHEKEFTLPEFYEALSPYFSTVECYGQFCRRPLREFLFMLSTCLYLRSNLYRRLVQSLAPLYFKGARAETGLHDPDWVERINEHSFEFSLQSVERATYFLAVCRKGGAS